MSPAWDFSLALEVTSSPRVRRPPFRICSLKVRAAPEKQGEEKKSRNEDKKFERIKEGGHKKVEGVPHTSRLRWCRQKGGSMNSADG